MAMTPGTRFGPYEVADEIGASYISERAECSKSERPPSR